MSTTGNIAPRNDGRGWLIAAIVLLLLATLCNSCASTNPNRQFHRPKYEMSTHGHPVSGQPAVRQTWFKRFWFWQREGARPNTHDR